MSKKEHNTNGPEEQTRKKNLPMLIVLSVLIVLVCVAAVVIVVRTVRNDNPTESTVDNAALAEQMRNTVAMTIGEQSLNAVELNYFYIETVNQFCQEYYYYIYYYGMIDVSTPLNEQYFDETNGTTWADYFLGITEENIKSTYLLSALAKDNGITLSQSDYDYMDSLKESIAYYATYYSYEDTNSYLVDVFGQGADLDSYMAYIERSLLADAYYAYYAESLNYTDEQMREYEKETAHTYNAYTYAYYYLDADRFLTGGSQDSDGNITYTDEQIAASLAAAKEAADALLDGSCADLEAFKELIGGMDINATLDSVSVTEKSEVTYSAIESAFQEWMISAERTPGEIAVIAKTQTTGEGEEAVEVTEGYYIVWFGNVNDNTFAIKDARHLLIMFKDADGKTYSDGITTFTDEQKAAAKAEAERLLELWRSGEATEEAFIALVVENSEDNVDEGGLYEYIYPGQMVENFENWCYDSTRAYGDTGIVESVYGYHVMFFVGDSDLNYRDYMITCDMRSDDLTTWHTELVESAELTEVCMDYCRLDMTLSG